MKVARLILTGLLLSMAVSVLARAQDCESFAKNNWYDTDDTTYEMKLTNFIKTHLESSMEELQSQQQASGASADANFVYDLIPIGADGHWNSSSGSEHKVKDLLIFDQAGNVDLHTIIQLHKRTGSPLALQAYLGCLNERSGSEILTTASGDLSRDAVLTVTYKPRDLSILVPKGVDVTYSNGTVRQTNRVSAATATETIHVKIHPGDTAILKLRRRDPRQKSDLVLVAAGIAKVYRFEVPPVPTTCNRTDSADYVVKANSPWWNSNFGVKPSEKLSITVDTTDTWTLSKDSAGRYPRVTADGWDWAAITARDPQIRRDAFVDPAERPGALLYRVGNSGAPLLLGNAGVRDVNVGQNGTLWFTANDDTRTPPASLGFTDNDGQIRVHITAIESLPAGTASCN